jgi:phage baseplate assembly protein V
MSQSFVFSEFARRLNNIVRFGTVAKIDLKKARICVQIGGITTNWIPWLTTAGTVKLWKPPVVGEQVCVISQGGDLALAVAIPSIFCNKFAAPSEDEDIVKLELSDKSSVEFNKNDDEIVIRIEGSEAIFGKDNIKANIGKSQIEINDDRIRFSVGESEIEITSEKISLHAPIIDAPKFR